jgi:hypothetical protein
MTSRPRPYPAKRHAVSHYQDVVGSPNAQKYWYDVSSFTKKTHGEGLKTGRTPLSNWSTPERRRAMWAFDYPLTAPSEPAAGLPRLRVRARVPRIRRQNATGGVATAGGGQFPHFHSVDKPDRNVVTAPGKISALLGEWQAPSVLRVGVKVLASVAPQSSAG